MYKMDVIYRTIKEVANGLAEAEPEVYTVETKDSRKAVVLTVTMPDESKRAIALAAYRYTSPNRAIRSQDAVLMDATNAPRKIVPFDHPGACQKALPQIVRNYVSAQK